MAALLKKLPSLYYLYEASSKGWLRRLNSLQRKQFCRRVYLCPGNKITFDFVPGAVAISFFPFTRKRSFK
jgi:hypothetical protein